MQKGLYCFLALVLLAGAVGLGLFLKPTTHAQEHTAYVRFHVRANSNSQEDQNVKYMVKEALVEYLTPFLAECETVERAKTELTKQIPYLTSLATQVLQEQGFTYGATVGLYEEYFPTRSYNSTTLESGIYDALIVKLGTGTGDNWWCVVYPPLCFVDAENVTNNTITYQSRLWEIIKKWGE